jgi:DNA-binding NarL/FixJ family response regulator
MSYRILIADDNPCVRKGLCELFEGESDFMICAEAEDGKEAIVKAQEQHPDLILLDLSMPVMNGLEAARTLKHLMPDVPIIMFSLFGGAFIEKEAQSAGVLELVSKSQPAAVLLSRVRSAVYRTA